ncbi:MAG: pilus assembly FimT family protein [Longimicrobiaceae bacterium]
MNIPAQRPSARPPGFTLLEILIALVVLGILVGLAVPRLTSWLERQRIQETMDRVASELFYAKMAAIRTGGRVSLMLEKEAGCVTGLRLVSDSNPHPPLRSADLTDELSAHCLTITNNLEELEFNSRGLTWSACTFELVHRGRDYQVAVSMMGNVRRNY